MTENFEGFGKKRDGFSHFPKRRHLGFVKSSPCDKSKNVVLDFLFLILNLCFRLRNLNRKVLQVDTLLVS